jgi:beta-glucanase (GH16 family)
VGAGLQLASPIRPANRMFVDAFRDQPDLKGMRTLRITVSSVAVLAMAAASLSTATTVFAAGSPQHSAKNHAAKTRGSVKRVALHESVKSAGAYDVTVKVTSHAGANHSVQLKIGRVVRRTITSSQTHRVTVTQRIALGGRRLTIHASARQKAPTIFVTWRRVKKPPVVTPAPAPVVPAPAAPPTLPAAGSSIVAPVALAAQALAAGPLGVAGAWHPIFDDEFNASSLNASVWNAGWIGSGLTGPMNTEEQECYSPSQVAETGGELDLTAAAIPQTGCPMYGGPSTVNEPYVSGMINTKDKFSYTYGYLETRVWLPGTPSGGTDWPAVWEVGSPAPANGEIDVIEGLSGLASWHFHDPSGAGFGGALGGYAGAWHTFGADWEPGSITFYYDGIKVGVETANITSAPMYLIANLAVDTNYGGPAAAAAMKIDYIRVFQH